MYSWCDIDLSLRCWDKGGTVEIWKDACVAPKQIEDDLYKMHRKDYWKHDVDTFFELWHDRLGQGLPREEGTVNRRL